MSPRRVLVVGGSGFLGRRITEAFVANGDCVAVLARGERQLDSPLDVEFVRADRHDQPGLRASLGTRDFDIVVDNVAFTAEDVASLLEICRDRVGHYLLTSSAAVYATRYVRRPIRESDVDLNLRVPTRAPDAFHPRLGHAYANGKRAAEQVVQDAAVPWTILRPPVVLGADDRTRRVWWLVQRLLDGEPLLVPDWGPGRVFQVAWTHDIARATVLAAGNARAFRQTYNVAQAEIYTAESWLGAAAEVLGVPPNYAHFAEADGPALGLAEYALPIAGRPFGHVLLDGTAIRNMLGFEPAPESLWLTETLRGCAASSPAEDSPGYAQRATEIRVARSLLARRGNTADCV